MAKIQKWLSLSFENIFSSGFFSLNKESCKLPDGRIMQNYYHLDCPNWVQVFALTKDNKLVLVEQYRQGNQSLSLELPGGSVDKKRGENDLTDALEAGIRELREETGYTSKQAPIFICAHSPNPALMRNKMYVFLLKEAELTHPQDLDPHEDIAVVCKSIEECQSLIQQNIIHHSLVIASIYLCLSHLKNGDGAKDSKL